MNQQIDNIKNTLSEQLLELTEPEHSLERLSRSLQLIDDAIREMNALAAGTPFKDEKQEIYFFKQAKPEILARRIQEIMLHNIHVNMPISTTEIKLKYYQDEIKARQSFFRMNSFHYQYYKNGLSDLDGIYFLRGAGPLAIPLEEFSEGDMEFSTPMTYLFAKFIAYEHVQYCLLEEIARLRYPENQQLKLRPQSSELKWTGDSVNIVELAYGLWLTGQLNNGNASLNQIVRWLEANLHVSIGIIQRRFNEIERRKRLSPTRYIDQMKEAILQKIENGNS